MDELELIGRLVFPDDAKCTRGTDVSDELTEIRTVLSRAETALSAVQRCRQRTEPRITGWTHESNPRAVYEPYEHDPDTDLMITVLTETVRMLRRWRKTGRTVRRVN